MDRRQILKLAGSSAVLGLGATKVSADTDEFPSRPITMIVPFPPGGVADAVGRPVAEALGRILKQAVWWRIARALAAVWAWASRPKPSRMATPS